jgi:hypothetical protein
MALVTHTIGLMQSPLFVAAALDTTGVLRKLIQVRITTGVKSSLAVDFAYTANTPSTRNLAIWAV